MNNYIAKTFFHEIDGSMNEMLKYKSHLERMKEIGTTTINPRIDLNTEQYVRLHDFEDVSIPFAWGVPLLNQLQKEHQINAEYMEISALLKYVDVDNLDKPQLGVALHNKKPIYVVHYEPLAIDIVVDGNHRIVAKGYQQQHNPSATIKGFYFPSELSLLAMESSFNVDVYRILCNLKRMNEYCVQLRKGDTQSVIPNLLGLDPIWT
ncbi:hypothetical protein [Paenibacillus sp. Root52]|uniref:hypothetical protein n=1 Tax=Paenibacillus sp. Root52 TaxID=1736552 RepID=UPI001F234CE6|nr:hypothetical protein [Paenibacillus sp. Root52]